MAGFEVAVKDKKSKARLGRLTTAHGGFATPVFIPIATQAAVKSLSFKELDGIGVEAVLANTYHMSISGRREIVEIAGGLHNFMNWRRPIITDSGGFQVFSLGEKMSRKEGEDFLPFNKRVSETGVEFQSHLDGTHYEMTPEKSVEVQLALGSDVAAVLDEFTGDIFNRSKVAKATERTYRWAARARQHWREQVKLSVNSGQIQIGVVQGGMFDEIRRQSAKQIADLGFEAFAIGGVAVGGESTEQQAQAVEISLPYLPENTLKHLFGVGTPEQILRAVSAGIDSFDCVIPTREARHGRAYIGGSRRDVFHYKKVDMTKSGVAADLSSLDENCDCFACVNHSRAYICHLLKSKEMLGIRLLCLHNVRFYIRLMEDIRKAIESGRLNNFSVRLIN